MFTVPVMVNVTVPPPATVTDRLLGVPFPLLPPVPQLDDAVALHVQLVLPSDVPLKPPNVAAVVSDPAVLLIVTV